MKWELMEDQVRLSAGWQVEDTASEAYERYLVPPIFAPWADRLVERGGIHQGDRVLDVACGTGIVARRAATRVGTKGSVVGLDINEQMLAVAEETTDGIQPSIEWRCGDASALPFGDAAFDVVCCQQALQFFDDPGAAIEEMARVLTSRGRIAVSVWRPLAYQPAYVTLADAMERHIGDEAGDVMRSPFPAWDGRQLRALVEDAGLHEVAVTIEVGSVRYPSVGAFVRREVASSPLAESIASLERGDRDELVKAVAVAVDGYTDDEGVTSPMESYVVTAKSGG